VRVAPLTHAVRCRDDGTGERSGAVDPQAMQAPRRDAPSRGARGAVAPAGAPGASDALPIALSTSSKTRAGWARTRGMVVRTCAAGPQPDRPHPKMLEFIDPISESIDPKKIGKKIGRSWFGGSPAAAHVAASARRKASASERIAGGNSPSTLDQLGTGGEQPSNPSIRAWSRRSEGKGG